MTKEEIMKTWVYYDPENNEYENVCIEAHYRARLYSRGIRGQMIMPQDSIEYWVHQVTRELYS